MTVFKGKMMGTRRSKEDLQKSLKAYSKQAEKKNKTASKKAKEEVEDPQLKLNLGLNQ